MPSYPSSAVCRCAAVVLLCAAAAAVPVRAGAVVPPPFPAGLTAAAAFAGFVDGVQTPHTGNLTVFTWGPARLIVQTIALGETVALKKGYLALVEADIFAEQTLDEAGTCALSALSLYDDRAEYPLQKFFIGATPSSATEACGDATCDKYTSSKTVYSVDYTATLLYDATASEYVSATLEYSAPTGEAIKEVYTFNYWSTTDEIPAGTFDLLPSCLEPHHFPANLKAVASLSSTSNGEPTSARGNLTILTQADKRAQFQVVDGDFPQPNYVLSKAYIARDDIGLYFEEDLLQGTCAIDHVVSSADKVNFPLQAIFTGASSRSVTGAVTCGTTTCFQYTATKSIHGIAFTAKLLFDSVANQYYSAELSYYTAYIPADVKELYTFESWETGAVNLDSEFNFLPVCAAPHDFPDDFSATASFSSTSNGVKTSAKGNLTIMTKAGKRAQFQLIDGDFPQPHYVLSKAYLARDDLGLYFEEDLLQETCAVTELDSSADKVNFPLQAIFNGAETTSVRGGATCGSTICFEYKAVKTIGAVEFTATLLFDSVANQYHSAELSYYASQVPADMVELYTFDSWATSVTISDLDLRPIPACAAPPHFPENLKAVASFSSTSNGVKTLAKGNLTVVTKTGKRAQFQLIDGDFPQPHYVLSKAYIAREDLGLYFEEDLLQGTCAVADLDSAADKVNFPLQAIFTGAGTTSVSGGATCGSTTCFEYTAVKTINGVEFTATLLFDSAANQHYSASLSYYASQVPASMVELYTFDSWQTGATIEDSELDVLPVCFVSSSSEPSSSHASLSSEDQSGSESESESESGSDSGSDSEAATSSSGSDANVSSDDSSDSPIPCSQCPAAAYSCRREKEDCSCTSGVPCLYDDLTSGVPALVSSGLLASLLALFVLA